MFSETEYQYLENIINTYILNGEYTHYVAYTYTHLGDYSDYNYYDFYVVLSKSEITANNNIFSIPSDSLKISVNSKNANRNYSNGARFTFTESERTINVNEYEFIYSNATNTKYADILAYTKYTEKINQENNLSFNLDKNEFYTVPLFLGLIIMMLFLKWCFPMKGGKK